MLFEWKTSDATKINRLVRKSCWSMCRSATRFKKKKKKIAETISRKAKNKLRAKIAIQTFIKIVPKVKQWTLIRFNSFSILTFFNFKLLFCRYIQYKWCSTMRKKQFGFLSQTFDVQTLRDNRFHFELLAASPIFFFKFKCALKSLLAAFVSFGFDSWMTIKFNRNEHSQNWLQFE